MRLSEVLSKTPTSRFEQVEGFLNNANLKTGKQKKISVGPVWLTYYCENCQSDITFISGDELYCIGIHERLVSIDCVLKCPRCGTPVPVWFLVESREEIHSLAPEVRILKKSEKLSDKVSLSRGPYEGFSDLLEKANRAYHDQLGAGSIVYLRKIFEMVTIQTANAVGIEYKKYEGGNPKNFSALLQEVDKQCEIIPKEFSANGHKLFKELSTVVHGDFDEELGLKKFDPLYRLVVGILENIRNRKELLDAVESLGWDSQEEPK